MSRRLHLQRKLPGPTQATSEKLSGQVCQKESPSAHCFTKHVIIIRVLNKMMTLRSPLVSWLGCTRWVLGSCWPHPQMVTADWSTLAWVQVGSPIPYSLGAGWVPKAVQVGSQQDLQWNNIFLQFYPNVCIFGIWLWDPTGGLKGCKVAWELGWLLYDRCLPGFCFLRKKCI